MNKKLLTLLVCPLCKGELHYDKQNSELSCIFDKLAYPIRNDIPVMLEGEARLLNTEEIDNLRKIRKST